MAGSTEDGGGRRNRWTIAWATVAALILLLPLFAMEVTDQVVWDVADFAVLGALLVGAGVTYELAARKTGKTAYRAAVAVALGAAFILVWVNGAVGVIGTERDDANLMYGGVLAVGIIGAIIARFQPDGMARALFATALAQALVSRDRADRRIGLHRADLARGYLDTGWVLCGAVAHIGLAVLGKRRASKLPRAQRRRLTTTSAFHPPDIRERDPRVAADVAARLSVHRSPNTLPGVPRFSTGGGGHRSPPPPPSHRYKPRHPTPGGARRRRYA